MMSLRSSGRTAAARAAATLAATPAPAAMKLCQLRVPSLGVPRMTMVVGGSGAPAASSRSG